MPRARSHFSLRRFTYSNGTRAWIVTGTTQAGLRVKRYFSDRDKAERCRQQIEFSEKSETEVDTYAKTRLTSGQIADAEMAYQLLGKLPIASLSEAVDWCSKNYVAPETTKSVHEAYQEMIEDKARVNLRKRSLDELRVMIGKIDQKLGALQIHQVTSASLEELIPSTASPRTRNHYVVKFAQFFNWAIKRGYIQTNPAEGISKARVDAAENIALSLAQVKAVLKASYGTPIQSLVALQLFAGLRNEEARRLDWSQVDIDDKALYVKPEGAKKRSARTVELHDEILPWLDLSQPIVPEVEEGVASSYRYRQAWEQMKSDAKITDRKYDNVLRHTALSFYSAKTQSIDKTINWGGTGVGPLFNNYRSLVKLKDVDAYWSLTPESLGLE